MREREGWRNIILLKGICKIYFLPKHKMICDLTNSTNFLLLFLASTLQCIITVTIFSNDWTDISNESVK